MTDVEATRPFHGKKMPHWAVVTVHSGCFFSINHHLILLIFDVQKMQEITPINFPTNTSMDSTALKLYSICPLHPKIRILVSCTYKM